MNLKPVMISAACTLATPLAVIAQVEMVSSSISSGGTAANGRFTAMCSITQPASGQPLSGGRFVFVPGFLAPVAVAPSPNCRADFNNSGSLDPDDIADYIGAFFAVPFNARADFDGDGEINPDDLADFLGAYFGGC